MRPSTAAPPGEPQALSPYPPRRTSTPPPHPLANLNSAVAPPRRTLSPVARGLTAPHPQAEKTAPTKRLSALWKITPFARRNNSCPQETTPAHWQDPSRSFPTRKNRAPPPGNFPEIARGQKYLAVAEGFEPSVATNNTRFRGEHLRPLGHATSVHICRLVLA